MFTDFKVVKGDKIITVQGKCIVTGEDVTITVPEKEFKDYYTNGKFAQDAFKSLTASQREFFISGCGPKGWEKLYG